jgi:MFS family permease
MTSRGRRPSTHGSGSTFGGPTGETGRRDRAPGWPSALNLAGSAVAVLSIIAFFRVALLPAIGDSLSLVAAELGVLTMIFGVGRLLTDVPAGRLADWLAPGSSFAIAAILLAAGSFGLAVAQRGASAYAAAFVLGVGSSISNTTGMTVFSRSVPRARRGTAMAVFSACLLGGQAVGPTVGGALTTFGSWRTAEAIAGILGLATATALLSSRLGRRRVAAVAEEPVGGDDRIPPVQRTILYGVSFAVFFTLGAMPQTLVPIIGAQVFGLGAPAIGLALGLGGLCRFGGAFVGGIVSDRVSRKAALVPGLLLMAAGVALQAIHGGIWIWLVAIVLMSVASFGVSVASTMLADRSRLGSVGRRLGGFRFVGDTGLIAGPVIAGVLFTHVGREYAVLTVAAVPALLAVASALMLVETGPRADAADAFTAQE